MLQMKSKEFFVCKCQHCSKKFKSDLSHDNRCDECWETYCGECDSEMGGWSEVYDEPMCDCEGWLMEHPLEDESSEEYAEEARLYVN